MGAAPNGVTPRCCGCCAGVASRGCGKRSKPAPPVALARLLPAWQGVRPIEAATGRGPGGYPARPRVPASMTGPGPVLDALDQLAGAFVPASALETVVLPGRVPGYSPAMLDELTTAGEVVWTGAGGLPGGDGWLVLAPAEAAPLLFPEPSQITMTPLHEAILTALADGGAVFFRMLHERVTAHLAAAEGIAKAPSDTDVAAAIWDLLWAGFLTNDTLGPLRTVLGGGQPRRAGPSAAPSRGRGLRQGSRRPGYGRPVTPSRTGPPNVSGRWSLLPPHTRDATMYAHALAQSLLDRYGILTKGAVAAERIAGGFAAVYPVLRAMEEAGRARRGYFVEGLGAAQFAVPGAVDRMRALAQPPSGPDETLSSVTRGRPVPYGAAYRGRVSGGDGVSTELWEYERDEADGTNGATEGGEGGGSGMSDGTGVSGGRGGGRGGGPEGGGREGGGREGGVGGFGDSGREGAARRAQVIVLAAADPANAYGASLAWPSRPDETAGGHRPGRKAGALVILADGELVLYVERSGRTLLSWTDDPQQLGPAAAALASAVRAGALGRLTVERADGGGVYDSPLAKALEEGRLPADSQGPAPARLVLGLGRDQSDLAGRRRQRGLGRRAAPGGTPRGRSVRRQDCAGYGGDGPSNGVEEVGAGLVDGGEHGAAQHRRAGDGGGHDAGAGRADAGDLGRDPVGEGGAARQADVAAEDDQAGAEDDGHRGDPDRDTAAQFTEELAGAGGGAGHAGRLAPVLGRAAAAAGARAALPGGPDGGPDRFPGGGGAEAEDTGQHPDHADTDQRLQAAVGRVPDVLPQGAPGTGR